MLSHRNFIANTSSIVAAIGLTERDRAMAVLPFHYSFGASVLQTHLAVGGTVVIDKRFLFPDKVLQRMIETRCTGFAGVPSHYQILLRKSCFKQMEFPDLRWLQQAGGKLQAPFVRELREAKPSVRLYLMYGATEATARLSILDPDEVDARPASIGKGIPGVTLRIVDEQGRPVAPGEMGEIVAEGENIARGYFQDPAETAATFRDDRLHTGDLATIDPQGYVTVLGRAKSFLKCGGTRMSAERFEEALLAFPDIVEAAVIGVPDEVMGEAPAAFVVARDPADVTVADRLGEFASENLPIALRPKLIEVVPELPKSPPARCSGSSCTNGCGRGRTRPDACNQSRATRLENRSAASSRLSSEVANERRRYPDPPGPNPAPSSSATASSWRSRSASAAALRGSARTSGKA